MKKNILVIHRGYTLGNNTGDKIRTLNMMDSLQNIGYNPILLGFFTRGIGSFRKEKKNLSSYKSVLLFSLPNRWGFLKMGDFFRAAITYFICKKYAIEIIQAEVSFSATCAKFVPEIPLVTDFHSDLVPELEMNNHAPQVVKQAIKENIFALKRSTKTITVSETLHRNLSTYIKQTTNNFILPTNLQSEPFLEVDQNVRADLRRKYDLEDKIVLCYSGGLHTWQCVQETLQLALQLYKMSPRYYFCFFTNEDISPFRELLNQLDGNYMHKSLKSSEVAYYLSMIDVGFVLRKNSLVNINSSPTKSSEYLAAGAMIITTQYAGDSPELVRESECGVVLEEVRALTKNELQELDSKIAAYVNDYASNAHKAKEYVFTNRAWSFNEKKLKMLYDEIELTMCQSKPS